MLRNLLLAMATAMVALVSAQSPSLINAVQVSATVQSSPASITLTWAPLANTSGFTIFRKTRNATSWGSTYASVAGSATQWTDNAVAVGTYYEYRVVRSSSSGTGNGYIAAGIEVPPVEYQGKLILLVDNTMAPSIAPQLAQLQADLKADGWTVIRQDVSRTASVPSIRSIIQGIYNADPTNVKAVYLVGHVPVPYSGNVNPDGHSSHLGAWPCDGYYADVNGTWTDNSVNSTGGYPLNHNVPGDGKFDQSDYPSALELQIGRVDLQDMPAFGQSEAQLLAAYLNKAHDFKVKQWVPQTRGIVFDNLQWVSNPLAASGYRSIAALVGHQNITDCYPYAYAFSTYVNNQSYLWTYSSGGGLQAVDNNVLTFNGANNIATTQDYATNTQLGGVFNMSFGSYFGDWDNRNNFLRAQIASGQGLTSVWSAIPNWWFHHMGLGDHIGYSAIQSMNNGSVYTPQNNGWQGATYGRVHLGLMGDPTLRMFAVAPPTNLQVTNAGGNASFTWTASPEPVAGYYLYQIDQATGVVTRVVPTLVTGTSFVSPTVPFVAGREYMVRAVKLQSSVSGSYYNLSLGALATASGSAGPDCLGVVGGPALPGTACNDGNACTINDVWNASCQCAGTASGDTDGDGICNATDNCPNVAGQIGSACNDGNACTINDVLTSSCQCVGTPASDSDGDGVCNALDNCPNVAGQIGSACNDGNACTTNDVLNSSCQCVGTASGDTDGDGICNAQDNCPTVPGVIGSPCNDGNACTANDVLNSSCQCVGTAGSDQDGDGICNAQDNCPTVPGVIGSPCNDGNACTTNDVLNSSCQCVGAASGDTDGDGICNAQDNCPTVPGVIGSACNDGNACTINDVLNSSCQCVGTASGDTDGDGICNAQDNCPTVPGQIGSACNDGNPCTVNDVINASCQCAGVAAPDSDGDGACDQVDGCPSDPNKTAIGICGCGNLEPGTPCNDGNAITVNDQVNMNCQCTGSLVDCDDGDPCTIDYFDGSICVHLPIPDGDGDGLCDAVDACPSGPNPGSACDDGNASTINDVVGVDCLCSGTLVVFDCAGVANGTASIDACGVCAGGSTGIVANSTCTDCAGVVNGTASLDACGTCSGGTTSIAPNSTCTDCLGVLFGTALPGTACDDGNANTINDVFQADCLCSGTLVVFDCAGVANGSAAIDACGVCAGGSTGNVPNTTCADCAGVPNGTASVDACGVCAGGSTGIVLNSSCTDCAGVVNGTASVDACGVCAGGSTGIVPNSSCTDCAGVVNGTASVDACGVCAGGSTGIVPNSSCTDCAGVVNGTASVDACGVCAGGSTGIVPNSSCTDCAGVVNGTASVDSCGVCAGGSTGIVPNSSCTDCAGVVNGTASVDACGVCAGGSTGIVPNSSCTDCAGVVNGTASVDACGVCAGGSTGIAPNSSCTDCLGVINGTALPGSPCNDGDPGTGNDQWSANCQCAGQVIDCLGVVGGPALPGTPCNDGNGGTQGDLWTSNCTCVGNSVSIDCTGTPGGNALPGALCDDGDAGTVNDSWTLDCECIGIAVDCAGVVGGTATIDDCGVCTGGTTGLVPNADVDGDGLTYCDDVCPGIYNPDQSDFDTDGVGDVCDNCPWVANGDQTDSNGNGIGDACEGLNSIAEASEVLVMTLFPNPVVDVLTVTITDPNVKVLRIVDLSGKEVIRTSVWQQVDLTHVAQGTYIVMALNAEGRPLAQTRLIRQ